MALCQGVFGRWCVYAIEPRYSPKKIRYRYPGEQWQEIAGDRYTTDVTTGYVYDPEKWYRFFWTAVNWFGQVIHTAYPGVNFVAQGRNFTIFKGTPRGSWNATDILFSYTRNDGTTAIGTIPILQVGNIFEYGTFINIIDALIPNTFSILRVEELDSGRELPPTTNCRFKVFNTSNQTILDITRNVCPEVEIIPERCEFKAEDEKLVGGWFSLFKAFGLERLAYPYAEIVNEGSNCVAVYVKSPLPPNSFYPLRIAYVCSQCPNTRPKVRVACPCEKTDPCENKKCPQGTVWKVREGNSLLCLDAGGCLLQKIPYDPNCEKENCTCE